MPCVFRFSRERGLRAVEKHKLHKKSFQTCLLAELMYCLFGSNSAVIRGFSIFTMLSDGRLKRLHDLINFCIALQINSKNWSKNGRPEIL